MKPNKRTPKTFKQKWNEVDETCPTCGQVTKVNRGLTRQNLQGMFKKPTLQDGVIFLMIILMLFGAWAYQNDIAQYREVIMNPQKLCQIYYEKQTYGDSTSKVIDLSNIELIENESQS